MAHAWITSRGAGVRLELLEPVAPGPVVVFVHGLGAHAEAYRAAIPGADLLGALRDEGLPVVAPDLPGHGRSGGRRGHLPFGDALAAIAETVGFALDRLGGPVVLAGASTGGVLAFYAALADERAAGAICHGLIDLRDVGRFVHARRRRAILTAADPVRRLAERAPLLPLPAGRVLAAGDSFEDPGNVRRWRRFPRMARWLTLETLVSAFLSPEEKPAAEAMDRPVLLLVGEEDPVVSPAAQEEMLGRLAGPGELVAVPGAGHMLPLEHPSAVVPAIAKWVRQLG